MRRKSWHKVRIISQKLRQKCPRRLGEKKSLNSLFGNSEQRSMKKFLKIFKVFIQLGSDLKPKKITDFVQAVFGLRVWTKVLITRFRVILSPCLRFKVLKNLVRVGAILWLLLYAFVSCDLSSLGVNRSRQYSIVSPEDNIASIPTDDFFYVNIKSAYYTGGQGNFDPLDFMLYALDEGVGTDCKISVNEESSTEDLYCMLDVAEGDLWYHEINLEYNVPPGMCAYLGFTTHWHYNQEVGEGPRRVVEIEAQRGDETITTYSPCDNDPPYYCEYRGRSAVEEDWEDDDDSWNRYSSYYCNNLAGSQEATDFCYTSAVTESNKDTESNQIVYGDSSHQKVDGEDTALHQYRCQQLDTSACGGTYREVESVCQSRNFPYDKSNLEGAGLGNCCLGKYFFIRSGETAEEREWGGDISQCIGGMGRLNWQHFNDDGWPITVVTESGSRGLNQDYTLHPLIQKIKTRVSFPTANYFEGVEEKAGTVGENFPDFYKNSNNCGDGKACPTGHPYLTWTCLDRNQEVLHQIKFIIRDWNSQEEFLSFKESEGRRGDPDVVGEEGSDCDYYESEEQFLTVFNNCNDILDADDKTKDPSRWQEYVGHSRNYPEINYGGGSSN